MHAHTLDGAPLPDSMPRQTSGNRNKLAAGVLLLQKGLFDLGAMSLALAAATTPPLADMTPRRPPRCICSKDDLILLTVMFLGSQLTQASHIMLLRTTMWFKGSNGTADYVSVLPVLLTHYVLAH